MSIVIFVSFLHQTNVLAQTSYTPLTWNDSIFNSNTSSSPVTVSNNGSVSYKSITSGGGSGEPAASVIFNGAGTMDHIRINSQEGVRVGGSGTVNITNSYIETTGVGDDHADGIQTYSPGSRGTINLTNSIVVSHNSAATAGLFVADNWTGNINLQDVVIQGGPYGIRIYPDTGGDNAISFNNVYFVGPFGYARFDVTTDIAGHTNHIVQWNNVRDATIVNGVLVPGALIPCPASNCGSTSPDTTPPASPTNLSANSTSQSSITVSWTASIDNVGVSNYLIERCQGTGCSNFTQVGTPSSSPFVDTNLTANTFYNYHVRAKDDAGNLSGWSNVVGATTQSPDAQAPSTPANLSASALSSSNINLTWTASTDNVAVTQYKVERCSGSNCTTFTQVGTPNTNSYSDTGLSASTLYRYRVRATDAANNNSPYSTIAQATTPVAPSSPTFISEYETTWNSSTSPKTTSNFSVQTGDMLIAYSLNEDAGNTIATPPTGSLSGTWTLQQSNTTANYTGLRLWSMVVSTNQSNVNVSFSNTGGNFGGDVLHFRNASGIGTSAKANNTTGNPTLTLTNVGDNSTIVMVNGDWSAKTGARTYNTTQAGTFTETSAYADGSSYGVEAGYYANAGSAGNKTIGITAPTGMTWALAAVEVKGNPSTGTFSPCNTVTTSNFSQSAYNGYGAPYDAFQISTNLINATCSSSDSHTIQATLGQTGDTTRIVYTKGYYYANNAWTQYSGTCTGAQNGDWCQGSVSATITSPNLSTASASTPAYFVGMTCSVQGGSWRCGCRDTTCSNFYWQVQGAGQ